MLTTDFLNLDFIFGIRPTTHPGYENSNNPIYDSSGYDSPVVGSSGYDIPRYDSPGFDSLVYDSLGHDISGNDSPGFDSPGYNSTVYENEYDEEYTPRDPLYWSSNLFLDAEESQKYCKSGRKQLQ